MSDDSKLRDFTESLPMALLRARESVMEHFRPILRSHDITEQQWRVIRALKGHDDGMEISALAQECLILMPSLTRILKSLEARELVRRFSVEGDNRRSLIRLASKGTALHQKIAPHSEAEYQKIEQRVGKKQIAKLHEILSSVSG